MTKLALKRARDWRDRVEFLAGELLSLPDSSFVADVLDRKPVQLTPTDYCFVVRLVGRSNWRRALEAFEWLTLRGRHVASPRLAATIISILGRAGQLDLADRIFDRTENEPKMNPTIQVYNALMGAHARFGDFDRVKYLLNQMRSKRTEPDLVTFNTVINARAKAGKFAAGDAPAMLADVYAAGLRPDTVTYNTLISACSRAANANVVGDAIKVLDEMRVANCQPDLWTYNAMLSLYARHGRILDAQQLFDEMSQRGFSPDAVSYNSLIYAYAKISAYENVEKVSEEMIRAGFKKDEITYNTIIHMYGKMGKLDVALGLYNEMKLESSSPDSVTYTVLIDSLGKLGRMSEAGAMLTEMTDSEVRPTLRTFSAMICGYSKGGMRDEAEKMFSYMVRSGIKPDNLAYSVMLDVFLRAKEARKVMVLYREMLRDGFWPDEGLYEFMIHVLVKDNRDDFVDEVVRDMEVCGMSLKLVCSILVKGECYLKGAEMLKRAVEQGCKPDPEDFFAILNSFSSSGMQEEAQILLNFFRDHGPDYPYLLSEASIVMLCKSGQLEAALEEYNKMKTTVFESLNMGCSLFECMIKSCEEVGAFSKASQLFSDMKFLGISPSLIIFESMITVYCRLNFPETANCLINAAEKAGFAFSDDSSYISLIGTYGKLKLWQKAESFVGKLRLQMKVDRKVWNALIYAYAESGQYEHARAIFNTMIRDGPLPNVDSINGLMHALITDGRLNELYVVVDELQDMNFKINKSTILMMLDAFTRDGNIFEVKKIYNGMKAAGYLPSMNLYKSMISLLARGKRVRDVEAMVSEMEEAGFKPDLSVFNSLLKMYTAIGDFKRTAEVYQAIKESEIKPDEDTFNTLIVMYSKDLRPEEGFSILSKMRKQNFEPKLDAYKSLLAACGKAQLWGQAEELFEVLISKKCKVDRSFYHIMMKIFRDSGNHCKAESLLLRMKEAGVGPTVATMHMLMVSYGTSGQPQQAENVLNNLKFSGIELSTLPYSSVIDAYLKNGDYNMGISKLQQMKRDGLEPDHRIWTCIIRAASLCDQTHEAMMLLNCLVDTGFDLPIRLLAEKSESLILEVDSLLEQLIPVEDNASFNFVNALLDLLWAFERRGTACWIFQLAIKKSIYRHDIFRVADKDWRADFRKLSAGAALVALTLWLDHMQDASLEGYPESPKSVVLVTGVSEYHMVSLNKTLKAYLWEMGSPFLPCRTRTGVLVAKAHSLRMWLKDSSFCLDLELKNALSLPKSNSTKLTDGYFMRAALVPVFKDINDRLGQVRPKKFARLALLSEETRSKVIDADIKGREEKLEKLKKQGVVRARKPTKHRTRKFMRRQHKVNEEARSN